MIQDTRQASTCLAIIFLACRAYWVVVKKLERWKIRIMAEIPCPVQVVVGTVEQLKRGIVHSDTCLQSGVDCSTNNQRKFRTIIFKTFILLYVSAPGLWSLVAMGWIFFGTRTRQDYLPQHREVLDYDIDHSIQIQIIQFSYQNPHSHSPFLSHEITLPVTNEVQNFQYQKR